LRESGQAEFLRDRISSSLHANLLIRLKIPSLHPLPSCFLPPFSPFKHPLLTLGLWVVRTYSGTGFSMTQLLGRQRRESTKHREQGKPSSPGGWECWGHRFENECKWNFGGLCGCKKREGNVACNATAATRKRTHMHSHTYRWHPRRGRLCRATSGRPGRGRRFGESGCRRRWRRRRHPCCGGV